MQPQHRGSRAWRAAVARALDDFDENGFDDLAVGAPTEMVGAVTQAGAVQIFYGTANGLSTNTSQFLTKNMVAPSGGPEPFDVFGTSLASGDIDDDGFPDLAVGSPGLTHRRRGLGFLRIAYWIDRIRGGVRDPG